MQRISTRFTDQVGVDVPIVCGAMYPCSNPELIAAVSEAGGLGMVQPLSMVYVYGYDFREGLGKIKSLTSKPFGMNVIVEKSSSIYENRMKGWVDIALEEGCRFFITALGNPSWVVEKVHAKGGVVYHNVTELKWAEKAVKAGVDGLVCVNDRAGGHAGTESAQELFTGLSKFGLPIICAGGIGDAEAFCNALELGYDAVQMGTRFIATHECKAHDDYKNAILGAEESDIVLTERVTGVPLSVIRTPYVEKVGLKVGPIARFLFKFRKTREWLRFLYNAKAVMSMKRSNLKGLTTKDYYQAGKSVNGIESVESAGDVVRSFADAYRNRSKSSS